MHSRRYFINKLMLFFSLCGSFSWPLFAGLKRTWAAAAKVILPKETDPQSLKLKNPAQLDTGNLEVMPLDSFGTMGLTDFRTDLNTWRLEINGAVNTPLQLTYADILQLPAVEKNVLLICPGVFVNHGRWKGLTIRALIEKAGRQQQSSRVTVRGPQSNHEKVESFSMEDILADKIFLAYGVNGAPLPQKHGFPLRLVAEDHYGHEWVKYVYRVTVE